MLFFKDLLPYKYTIQYYTTKRASTFSRSIPKQSFVLAAVPYTDLISASQEYLYLFSTKKTNFEYKKQIHKSSSKRFQTYFLQVYNM